MAKLRAVIFDIGRVLVRINLPKVKSELAQGLPLTPEELWSAIEKDPRWPDWQEGRMAPRDWHLHLGKRFHLALSFEEFTKVWNSALDPEPIHNVSLFEQLAKNYKLGLLSNTDPIHVAKLEATYDFFAHFPKAVRTYSCGVGASKPHPLIYREALRACKARAEEAVYIDDILEYVEAARRLGLTGIQFQSPAQLRKELGEAGIEVEDSCTA
ncbi:MAG TPA: HAD family phosphatase [Candidatus Eisenbacteria bacterium]|nr:HAD family phosphatase [Candidatus Eisenbacteria bacterium]